LFISQSNNLLPLNAIRKVTFSLWLSYAHFRYFFGNAPPSQTVFFKCLNIFYISGRSFAIRVVSHSKYQKSLGFFFINHLFFAKCLNLLFKITVKVYRVFPSNRESSVFSRTLQFRKNYSGDSGTVVLPFMQDWN